MVQVGFLDAMRFKGAAPEIVNCRLAMLGFVAAVAAGGFFNDLPTCWWAVSDVFCVAGPQGQLRMCLGFTIFFEGCRLCE